MMSVPQSEEQRPPGVPPLPGEDHRCPECRLDYGQLSLERVVEMIESLSIDVRAAVEPAPAAALRRRPNEGAWSVTEYVCHLRDVCVAYTIRLHRARTEEGPVLEPMLNDLRARRFRYNDSDLAAVLRELDACSDGLLEEIARFGPDGWDRLVTRLPGEQRTARWLARQAAHEARHHVGDIRRTVALLTPKAEGGLAGT
jgi:hypothetical protein